KAAREPVRSAKRNKTVLGAMRCPQGSGYSVTQLRSRFLPASIGSQAVAADLRKAPRGRVGGGGHRSQKLRRPDRRAFLGQLSRTGSDLLSGEVVVARLLSGPNKAPGPSWQALRFRLRHGVGFKWLNHRDRERHFLLKVRELDAF